MHDYFEFTCGHGEDDLRNYADRAKFDAGDHVRCGKCGKLVQVVSRKSRSK